MKQWFSDMQKEVHVLGPLLPPGYGTKTQNGEEGTSADIETLLMEMLVQHGERSVFFVKSESFLFFRIRTYKQHNSSQVSFGSLFWPPVSEYVDELIEALIAKKAPFVRLQLLFIKDFMIQACYRIRFLLMRPILPHYRSNRQNESNHQVWE